MAAHGSHAHGHSHSHDDVHFGEADWAALADHAALEGEVFLGFVTESAAWVAELRGDTSPPVRRVLDIGSGPGVGTAELARCFPDAQVTAIDGSPAMLERTLARAAASGLGDRIGTHHAELPDGLDAIGAAHARDGIEPADVIWASLSLHHVGDVPGALRRLRGLLVPTGLIAVAEFADPLRLLPDAPDFVPPGLVERMDQAAVEWFAALRAGLPGGVATADLTTMFTAAGFEVLGTRIARAHIEPPLSHTERRFAIERLALIRRQLESRLGPDDLDALAVLVDPDDPRSLHHRPDVRIDASREIVVARPRH